MSVIFKTLKKLRNAPYENQQGRFLKKVPRLHFLSKSLVPAAVLILVTLGIGLVYGTHVLGRYFKGTPKQEGSTSSYEKTSTWRAEYIAPTDKEPAERFATTLAKVAAEEKTSRSDTLEKENTFSDQMTLAHKTTETWEAFKSAKVKHFPRLTDKQNVDGQQAKIRKDNRLQRIRVQQCSEITSLVDQLEKLLTAGDMQQSKELIDRLAALKGEEDGYVIKLRSYWHMRQGQYSDAEPLLAMVLEKNQDDLEAGINMAIVEINANKISAARSRLIHLKTIYDTDTVIPELLRQIERQH